jgi:hypothetical protein
VAVGESKASGATGLGGSFVRPNPKALAYEGVVSGVVMGIIGVVGWLAHQPWLFPSLGPTIFLQTANSEQLASRPWSVFAGHAAGAIAGFACVFATHAQWTPAVMSSGMLTPERILATALAVTVTMVLQAILRAPHPPAAATTMLITLGGLKPKPETAVTLFAGVLLVMILGEAARHLHPFKEKSSPPT